MLVAGYAHPILLALLLVLATGGLGHAVEFSADQIKALVDYYRSLGK